jgi:PQQ-like domain
MPRLLLPLLGLLALTAGLAARQAPRVNVTTAMILNPPPDTWPTYFGDYSGRRFSRLTKITDKNVKNLSLAWMAETTGGGIKATPLLVNGVLYFATPDHAWAMDARTGRELWHYVWTHNRGGIHIGNRGVALYGNTVYFETPDCNLVALEADTGQLKWFKEICSLEMVYYASVAPLIVKDKIITGVSGDDLDMPGYVDARSLETGDLIWRWYVTPQKKDDPGIESWPNLDAAQHGGGMTWQPFTYDPEANLLYVPTGNPQPVIAWKNRPGANLFTASVVAIHADTGKMAWYFQTSPHDTHDLDSTQAAVLFDLPGRQGAGLDRIHQDQAVPRDRRARPAGAQSGERSDARRHHLDQQRHQLDSAGLQPADRPVLRQREPELRHLLRLRPQRQPAGLGRRRAERGRGLRECPQGHRRQDRADQVGDQPLRRGRRPGDDRGQSRLRRRLGRPRGVQRDHRRAALGRQSRGPDERSDHVPARWQAIRPRGVRHARRRVRVQRVSRVKPRRR